MVQATKSSSSVKQKESILIGPKFVTTPNPYVRFSNSTGAKLRCAATGSPSPVSKQLTKWIIHLSLNF